MLAAERRNIILQKAHDNGKVIVGELSREFDVTEETIRRDLERLEEEGHVTKIYGGAVFNDKSIIDLPFNVRWKSHSEGKMKIASLVSNQIEDGDKIFLDASTTAVMIAKFIKTKRHITVITNSIENILELSDMDSCRVISTGGELKNSAMSLVGSRALEGIGQYYADKVFLSCKGLTIDKGVMDGNDEAAGVKKAMIASAEKVYLAVDSSKFDKAAFSGICGFDRICKIITDSRPKEIWMEFLHSKGIDVIYPDNEGL